MTHPTNVPPSGTRPGTGRQVERAGAAGTAGAADAALARAGDGLSHDQARSIIRSDISDTRHRMSGTLDELAERLNPNRFKRQVKNDIRNATIGRMGTMARSATGRASDTRDSIIDTLRENPIPAAMAAVGLGWLFMNRSETPHREHRQHRFGRSAHREEWAAQDHTAAAIGTGATRAYAGDSFETDEYWREADDSSHEGRMDRMKERAGEKREEMRERTQHAKEAARERMDETRTRAREMTSRARERTMEAGRATKERAMRAERRVEESYQDNPLALGAAALALGFVAGISAPATRKESEWMGETRDNFVDRVKHELDDAKEKAQHVGNRVLEESKETAKEAAREEGLRA